MVFSFSCSSACAGQRRCVFDWSIGGVDRYDASFVEDDGVWGGGLVYAFFVMSNYGICEVSDVFGLFGFGAFCGPAFECLWVAVWAEGGSFDWRDVGGWGG